MPYAPEIRVIKIFQKSSVSLYQNYYFIKSTTLSRFSLHQECYFFYFLFKAVNLFIFPFYRDSTVCDLKVLNYLFMSSSITASSRLSICSPRNLCEAKRLFLFREQFRLISFTIS